MPSVLDVAAYILEQRGGMTAMKLQKLVYYSKAWHLVWEEKPLFPERIEAWANGPVSPALYDKHRRQFVVEQGAIDGEAKNLGPEEQRTVQSVLAFYGEMSALDLSALTHREDPWRTARNDLPNGAYCREEISESAMAEYYGSLV